VAITDFVVHGGDLFFRSHVPEKIVDLAYQPLYVFSIRLRVLFRRPKSEKPTLNLTNLVDE
jgi:DNA repair exonuclease SbcCD nuclease subunit